MQRTIEDVQKEYNAQAAMLGDLEYRLRSLEIDKMRMLKNLKELQKAAARIAGKNPPAETAPVEAPAETEVTSEPN